MRGVPLATHLDAVGLGLQAGTAIFRCADHCYTTHRISDMLAGDAHLAYEINGKRIEDFGYPLRLVAPGTYGYRWAKWVVRIELVSDLPKRYWEQKGLPVRGSVVDNW